MKKAKRQLLLLSISIAALISFPRWVMLVNNSPHLNALHITWTNTIVSFALLLTFVIFSYFILTQQISKKTSTKDHFLRIIYVTVFAMISTGILHPPSDPIIERRRLFFTLLFTYWLSFVFISIIARVLKEIQKNFEQKIQEQQLISEKSKYELEVLRNQLDAHFLFNSLNTLSSLVREKSENAISYINSLSKVLRITIVNNENDLHSIQKELSYLKHYYFLLTHRFGDSLQLNIHLPPEILEKKIPVMTLQLLLENAVKHNRLSAESPLIVSIEYNKGKIIVSNNHQQKIHHQQSTKIGLQNLNKRFLLFNKKPIDVQSENDEFTVKISI